MCLAIPGKILSITDGGNDAFRSGRVDFGGVTREINLAFVPGAAVGKYVLAHAGIAINTIDEEQARRTLELIREMNDGSPDAEGKDEASR